MNAVGCYRRLPTVLSGDAAVSRVPGLAVLVLCLILTGAVRASAQTPASTILDAMTIPIQNDPPKTITSSMTGSSHTGLQVNASGVPAYTQDFNALDKALDTSDKLIAYMDLNFSYQKSENTPRPIQTPQQTNSLKGGECGDFAAFSSKILVDHGFADVQEINYMLSPGKGHVVTLFKENGADWIISNGVKFGPVMDQASLRQVLGQAVGVDPKTISSELRYLAPNFQGALDFPYVAPK